MALFAPNPIGSTEGNIHLVEMRAGKMFRQGTWVYPDDRKGSLYIYRNSDDLMHFCWKDRITLMVEDDFIVFPGDCTYSKVKQCTTGRVYVLKFDHSSIRMFYWLQEPKTDKDDEHCRRINYLLNHSPVHHTSPAPFNISRAQLSKIFGPDVAAQLSAIMMNEENIKFASKSDSEYKGGSETKNQQDTTALFEGGASSSNEKGLNNMGHTKRSSLKSDTSDDIERKRKNVTIIEVQGDRVDNKDKEIKNKPIVTDDGLDFIDLGDEEEQSDADTNDESYTDNDVDENKN